MEKLYCDKSRVSIEGDDVGSGRCEIRTPDGYVIEVEVVGWPEEIGDRRPHLRSYALKEMIDRNAIKLLPPAEESDEKVHRIPRAG